MGDTAGDFASLAPEQGTQLKGESKLRFVTQVCIPSPCLKHRVGIGTAVDKTAVVFDAVQVPAAHAQQRNAESR